MGFRSLQHIQPRGSTLRGRCLPALFRPQGLATLSTAYAPRSLAGSFSHRQRSWDSPSELSPHAGYSSVSTRKHPPTVPSDVVPNHRSSRPARRTAVPGFCPLRESSDRQTRYERANNRMLPWVSPSWGLQAEDLSRNFAQLPPTCFPNTASYGPMSTAPRSISRPSPRPAQLSRSKTGSGNPFRVLVPSRSPAFGRAAFRAMCSPLACAPHC